MLALPHVLIPGAATPPADVYTQQHRTCEGIDPSPLRQCIVTNVKTARTLN